jgi:hypothetical protein
MRIPKTTLAAAAMVLCVAPAFAEPAKPDIAKLVSSSVIEEMHKFIDTEIVQVSIQAQNDRFNNLAQDKIDQLDGQWKAEREAADKPLIAATLSNPLSVYLARMQGKSLGLYAEIFVMDQMGLNVGQSSVTSDFWQGDEDKYQKTFAVGEDALFVDEPEWDEDFKIWRNQVSFTIVSPEQKKIGAVTVELNLTELERRMQAGS